MGRLSRVLLLFFYFVWSLKLFSSPVVVFPTEVGAGEGFIRIGYFRTIHARRARNHVVELSEKDLDVWFFILFSHCFFSWGVSTTLSCRSRYSRHAAYAGCADPRGCTSRPLAARQTPEWLLLPSLFRRRGRRTWAGLVPGA